MEKWEYWITSTTGDVLNEKEAKDITAWVNKQADDSWQLMDIEYEKNRVIAVFKRPKILILKK